MAFDKGDIIWVDFKNRHPFRLKHPAVVWEDTDDESDFLGIMLTHSGPTMRFDNILMNEQRFRKGYEFAFSNTHFVNQVFIKFRDWGPFHISGKLTLKGIEFIESRLTNRVQISFLEYISDYA